MSTTITDLIGLGDASLAAQEVTNAGADLAGAGNSFGALIKGVGMAVADTQLKLTENSAETTSTLASTLVDVIAVQETDIDDRGNITASKSHVQKLPLLNFVDPAFYNYSRVKIEGHFVIDSFAVDTNDSVKTSGSSFGGGFSFSQKPSLFGTKTTAGGSAGLTAGSQSTDLQTTNKQATSVGRMRLASQLEPQTGLGVPQPVQVIVGPSITIVEGPITEAKDGDVTTRTMKMLLQLRNKDGKPIGEKALSIDTDGALWDYENPDPTKAKTGPDGDQDAGNLRIQLQRIFATPDANTPPEPPKPVTVNVRLGIVAAGITVNY